MNPFMMIPHNYRYRKTHRADDPKITTTTIRYDNFQKDPKQLYCHSPSKNSRPAWAKSVKAFISSGHAEDFDGLCWCE